jgi:hypothetical protein
VRGSEKITTARRERTAIVYVRQSSVAQVRDNTESTARQYALADEAVRLGWARQVTSVMYVNRSTDGGLTWGPPIELIRDASSFLFNDKNSMTADPFDSRFAYAIWDRSRFPSDVREFHSLAGFPASFRSDATFTRTTDGGATWEPARPIFQPRANQFGIGHQIAVLSDGTLVDGFMLFHGSGRNKTGQEIAVMISRDRGETWTEPIRVAKALPGFVSDPDDGFPLRTGDIIPEIAAGPNGSAFMVWQEATLAPSGSAIALSKSLDGGLTWSEPVRINTRADVQAFTPSVDRAPQPAQRRSSPMGPSPSRTTTCATTRQIQPRCPRTTGSCTRTMAAPSGARHG